MKIAYISFEHHCQKTCVLVSNQVRLKAAFEATGDIVHVA